MLTITLTSIREAFLSLRSNKLRASLTILIIAFGITALVGVLTAIDSVEYWLRSTFFTMGSNTFRVVNRVSSVRIGHRTKRKVYPKIYFREANALAEHLREQGFIASVKINLITTKVRYKSKETTPNVSIIGADEYFLQTESYKIDVGRFFSPTEILSGAKVVVISSDVREQLFGNISPLNKFITLGKKQYKVIGVLAKRGNAFGSSGDKVCIIPITTARKDFRTGVSSYVVNVNVPQIENLSVAINKTIEIFRIIRKLRPKDENNFGISVSDTFIEGLMENLRILTWSSIGIGIITLLGAVIGLMNIMLVSVTERTKEIGIRMALGATKKAIRLQFLIEALVIGQLGALLGTLLGIAVGNTMSFLLNSPFILPVKWLVLAIILCIVVSIVAGIYPANKAASINPIEALRYE